MIRCVWSRAATTKTPPADVDLATENSHCVITYSCTNNTFVRAGTHSRKMWRAQPSHDVADTASVIRYASIMLAAAFG